MRYESFPSKPTEPQSHLHLDTRASCSGWYSAVCLWINVVPHLFILGVATMISAGTLTREYSWNESKTNRIQPLCSAGAIKNSVLKIYQHSGSTGKNCHLQTLCVIVIFLILRLVNHNFLLLCRWACWNNAPQALALPGRTFGRMNIHVFAHLSS